MRPVSPPTSVELSSNVVAGGASGGVLNARLAVNEADAPDHLAEPGRAVQSPPAALCAQTEPEDHGQRWRAMIEVLRRNNVTAWRESFLHALDQKN